MNGEDVYAIGDQTNLFSALSNYGSREEENYLEDEHFFCASSDDQLKILMEFLKRAKDVVKRYTGRAVPEQNSCPEESKEE